MDFKRSYPKLADYLSNRVDFSRKEQQQSHWHWFTLILFGLMTVATLSQKLILLTLFIAIVALIKGPVMILWGCCIPFGWAFSAYRYFAFSDFLFIEYRNIYKELADDLSQDLFLFLSFWSDGT